MRCCASVVDRRIVATLVLAWLLTGCGKPEGDFGFSLEHIGAYQSGPILDVEIQQRIALSAEAKRALNHGVPLYIRTELSLRAKGSGRDISRTSRELEIRYLPLSKRYELLTDQPRSARSFPRLRHLLAEVAVLHFALPVPELAGETFELRARTFLDKGKLPPPLRLPSRFSAQWHHDSGWNSWAVTLGENA